MGSSTRPAPRGKAVQDPTPKVSVLKGEARWGKMQIRLHQIPIPCMGSLGFPTEIDGNWEIPSSHAIFGSLGRILLLLATATESYPIFPDRIRCAGKRICFCKSITRAMPAWFYCFHPEKVTSNVRFILRLNQIPADPHDQACVSQKTSRAESVKNPKPCRMVPVVSSFVTPMNSADFYEP